MMSYRKNNQNILVCWLYSCIYYSQMWILVFIIKISIYNVKRQRRFIREPQQEVCSLLGQSLIKHRNIGDIECSLHQITLMSGYEILAMWSPGCVRDGNATIYSNICVLDPRRDARRIIWWYHTLHPAGVGSAHHFQGMYCSPSYKFYAKWADLSQRLIKYFVHLPDTAAKVFHNPSSSYCSCRINKPAKWDFCVVLDCKVRRKL